MAVKLVKIASALVLGSVLTPLEPHDGGETFHPLGATQWAVLGAVDLRDEHLQRMLLGGSGRHAPQRLPQASLRLLLLYGHS